MANYGDIYKFRKELLQALIAQKNQVYVSVPDGDYDEPLRRIGCILWQTPIDRRGTNPLTDLRLMFCYYRMLNAIKPDAVLTYTIKPNAYGGLLCRTMSIPYITTITGMGSAINNGGIIKTLLVFILKSSLKKTECTFFQNKMNREYFLSTGIVTGKNQLVPGSGVNLADHPLEEYPGDDRINFLFIGRVMKDKGIDEYLAAAEKIKAMYPFTDFQILGFCEEAYEKKLKHLQEHKIVTYHGFQDDVHSFIKASHAVILPSYHEGMSNVLLEAASTGRPVIASDIPGCRETFDEGISGYGIEVGNTEDLIAKVEKFIHLSHEDKRQMGLAGRVKVESEFSRQKVTKTYLEMINEIMARNKKEGEQS